MRGFEFSNRTRIIFGKGTEARVGAETKKLADRVLLHYGSGSIKKSGLYDRITASLDLSGVERVELAGVEPNPRLSLVKEGIRLCRENDIKFILAVGGGSVIDSAKAIAVGAPYKGDVWDFFVGNSFPQKALGVGTVLTIPAAGSESSASCVITNTDSNYKLGLTDELLRPEFSILNPELSFTLPPFQTACGAADIMAHIMERYFTNTKKVELSDRLCEAAMKTLVNNALLCIQKADDYDARAEMMWTGCVAHNDLLGMGRNEDWASHGIEHEISAIYDIAHGAGLACVFPAWMKKVYRSNIPRFVQFASRVWNVEIDSFDQEKTALLGIARLEEFFRSMGLVTTLAEMGIKDDRLEEMADKCTRGAGATIGSFAKLDRGTVLAILKSAYKEA